MPKLRNFSCEKDEEANEPQKKKVCADDMDDSEKDKMANEPQKKKVRAADIDDSDKDISHAMESMKIKTLNEKGLQWSLQTTEGSQLALLHQTSLSVKKNMGMDFVQMLADVAAEENFDVCYIESDRKNEDEEVHCLVELSTMPVVVCYTAGKDKASAKLMAARAALNCLKMMSFEECADSNVIVAAPAPVSSSEDGYDFGPQQQQAAGGFTKKHGDAVGAAVIVSEEVDQ